MNYKLILHILLLFFAKNQVVSAITTEKITYIYKGAIKESLNITLQISIEDKTCIGTYYYDNIRKDISLQGSKEGDEWRINETGGGLFKGKFSADFLSFSGDWSNAQKGISYTAQFQAVLPTNGKTALEYTKVKAFQELLNLFNQSLLLPLSLKNKLKNNPIYNSKKNLIEIYNQPTLTYSLASKYIMGQTKLSLGSYFNRSQDDYYNAPYRVVGQLFSTSKWVGLLLYLEDDTGWDEYEVFFGLVFDYEGSLLSEWKAYTYFITEKTGEISSERTISTIQSNYTIDLKSERLTTLYGRDSKTGKEYVKDITKSQSGYYKISKEGKWEKVNN